MELKQHFHWRRIFQSKLNAATSIGVEKNHNEIWHMCGVILLVNCVELLSAVCWQLNSRTMISQQYKKTYDNENKNNSHQNSIYQLQKQRKEKIKEITIFCCGAPALWQDLRLSTGILRKNLTGKMEIKFNCLHWIVSETEELHRIFFSTRRRKVLDWTIGRVCVNLN